MKKLLLGLGLAFCTQFAFSQNGLESIVVEKYYVADANDATGDYPVNEGSVTYRIYLDLADGYNFQAAYGDPNHVLEIKTTTYFFNNEDRGNTSPTYTTNHAEDNTVMLDSWLSTGAACSGQWGVLKTEDDGVGTIVNADNKLQSSNATAGIAISQQDGMIAGTTPSVGFSPGLDVSMFGDINNNGNTFSTGTTGGTWYAAPGTQGPTSSNMVLIGQFTTDGDFSFELNVQIGTPTGGVEKYVSKSHIDDVDGEIEYTSLKQSFSPGQGESPTVSITAPTSGSTLTNGVATTITASANDTDGTISSVEFFVDGTSLGTVTSAPYEMSYTPVAGAHIITAIATDNDNNQTTSGAVSVTSDATSITDINSPKVNIFPTIVGSYVQILIENNTSTTTLEITSIAGKTVFTKTYTQNSIIEDQISVASLEPGMYIVSVKQSNSITYSRIIKE